MYKTLFVVLVTAGATFAVDYLAIEREAVVSIEGLKVQAQAAADTIKEWKTEQYYHDDQLDERLRLIEEETAEIRARLGLPHRNIASRKVLEEKYRGAQ